VVWTGIKPNGEQTSHWTRDGDPLPHVPFIEDWQPDTHPPAYVDFYRLCRERFPASVEQASIPVERIPQVVLVVGGDDQVWPSELHANAIADRRASYGQQTTIVFEQNAGHRALLPGEPAIEAGMVMQRGGSEPTDRHLGGEAWPHIIAMLLPS
ncbi:MAG TPA: acyl-CoA thioester hydrolase/BAAT C-terminal domain-containing protein, partial [Marmoricola sp.]|nr:acyl-CoA thioester hydrolase/BAAT C-terminal domain-containing protein [Marmoricola sp.]